MFARMLLFVLCSALLAAGGCARSDDGTVVIPRPLDARRIWDKPPRPPAGQPQMVPGVFPAPPQPPGRPPPRRFSRTQTEPQTDSPPSLSSEPENPLTCRNVSESGKRYRVVCD